MAQLLSQLTALCRNGWEKLTHPIYPFSNQVAEQQSRAITTFMLVSILVSLLGAISVSMILTPAITVMSAWGFVVMNTIMYWVSRTRHYQIVVTAYILVIYITQFSMYSMDTMTAPDRPFAFLVLTVLLAGIFYPIYWTIGFAVFNLISIALIGLSSPTPTAFITVFILNVLVSSLVLIISYVLRSDIQRLTNSEMRYRQLMEANYEAVIVCNADCVIIDVNSAFERTFSYQRADVIGKKPDELNIPIAKPTIHRTIYEPEETVALTQKGVPLNIEVNTHLQEVDGELLQISVIRDITARKRHNAHYIEVALQQERVKMLQGFIDDTSHYFRTPITNMKNNIYLAEKTSDKPDRQAKHIGVIKSEMRRLEELLDNLLTMTRLEKEETADYLYVGRFDINSMLREIAGQWHSSGDDLPDVLLTELDDTVPPIFGDKMQLSEAFQHLIHNARLYSRGKPSVEIRTKTDDKQMQVRVEVEDHGIGIADGDKLNIFQSFYRTDAAREIVSEGSGLGLTIAKKIIDRHRGVIYLESEVGVGSTFCVVLPSVNALPGAVRRIADENEKETQEAPAVRRAGNGHTD